MTSQDSATGTLFQRIAIPVLERRISQLSLNLERTPDDVFQVATTLSPSKTEATHKPDSSVAKSKIPAVTGTAATGNDDEPSQDYEEAIRRARQEALKKW